MCEDCSSNEKFIDAHEELEAAINKFLETMERVPANSIMTDWVLVSARSVVDDGGRSETVVGYEVGLNQPHHRTKGLLHEAIDYTRSNDTAHILLRHLGG